MSISIFKKAAALLCGAFTAVSLSAVLSASASDAVFEGEQKYAAPGEEVSYSVSIKNNPGYAALGIAVFHDERLEVLDVSGRSVKVAQGSGSTGLSVSGSYKSDARSVAVSTMGTDNCTEDGVIFTFKVKVPEDAKDGDTYPMDIRDTMTQFVNVAKEDQSPYTVIDGWIKVVAPETTSTTESETTTTQKTTDTTPVSSDSQISSDSQSSGASDSDTETTTTAAGTEDTGASDSTSNNNGGSDVPGPKTGETGAALAIAGLLTAAGAAYVIRKKD